MGFFYPATKLFYQCLRIIHQTSGKSHQCFLLCWANRYRGFFFVVAGKNDTVYFHRHHFLQHCGSGSGVFKYKVKKPFAVHGAAIAVIEFCFNPFKKNGGRGVIIKTFINPFNGEKNIYFPAPGINRY